MDCRWSVGRTTKRVLHDQHPGRNATERRGDTYDRHEYIDEDREILEAVAREIDRIVSGTGTTKLLEPPALAIDHVEDPSADAGERLAVAPRPRELVDAELQQTTRRLPASSTVKPSISCLIRPSRSSVAAVSGFFCPSGTYLTTPPREILLPYALPCPEAGGPRAGNEVSGTSAEELSPGPRSRTPPGRLPAAR